MVIRLAVGFAMAFVSAGAFTIPKVVPTARWAMKTPTITATTTPCGSDLRRRHHRRRSSLVVVFAGGFEWQDPQDLSDQDVGNPFKNEELLKGVGDGDAVEGGMKVDPARLLGPRLQGCNLYLIGMMGCGKSVVGDIVARRMGSYNFLDTDNIIEAAAGTTVSEIFATNGEDSFRDIESQILDSVHAYVRCVISTGGGIIMRPKNWSKLQSGVVVYLDVPTDVLAERLTNSKSDNRPLLKQGSKEDVKETLTNLLEQRESKYRQADVIVSVEEGMSPDQTADLVVRELHDFIDNNPPAWKTTKARAQEEGLDWVQ